MRDLKASPSLGLGKRQSSLAKRFFESMTVPIILMAALVVALLHVPVDEMSPQVDFPVSQVLGKFGAEGYEVSHRVSHEGLDGYVLTRGDLRVLVVEQDGRLLLGNILDANGEDLTEKMAAIWGAESFLTALARGKADRRPAAAGTADDMENGERLIRKETFEYILNLPHRVILNADAPVRMVVFSWESCGSCRLLEDLLRQQRDSISFGIIEIPTGGDAVKEQNGLRRLRNERQWTQDEKLRGVREAALLVQSLTGKLAVPCYAWAMPDGSYRFGHLAGEEIRQRLELLKGMPR